MQLGPSGKLKYAGKPAPASCRKVVGILLDHGAEVDKDVMTAARDAGDEEIVLMLMEKYVEPAITEDDGGGGMFVNLFDSFLRVRGMAVSTFTCSSGNVSSGDHTWVIF